MKEGSLNSCLVFCLGIPWLHGQDLQPAWLARFPKLTQKDPVLCLVLSQGEETDFCLICFLCVVHPSRPLPATLLTLTSHHSILSHCLTIMLLEGNFAFFCLYYIFASLPHASPLLIFKGGERRIWCHQQYWSYNCHGNILPNGGLNWDLLDFIMSGLLKNKCMAPEQSSVVLK